MLGLRTRNLLETLRGRDALNVVLEQKASEFIAQPLSSALAEPLLQKGMTRSQAIRNSMLNTARGCLRGGGPA